MEAKWGLGAAPGSMRQEGQCVDKNYRKKREKKTETGKGGVGRGVAGQLAGGKKEGLDWHAFAEGGQLFERQLPKRGCHTGRARTLHKAVRASRHPQWS